ncbi:MAG: sigma-70 family RNA polymerase sigma factor [Paramuribaculum sp.]|nr:sigma-70 family RNA polymerase sigma factor [Paramuribaculum sp.]
MQNLAKLTDDVLVASYARGCNEAFDVLLNRYKTKLFGFIFQLVKDKDIADDIFQETFVKAIMTIRQGRYQESGRFGAWLCRIARNLVVDSYRQEKNEAAISADNAECDILNRKELSDPTVEDQLIDFQIEDDVRRLMEHLPEPQREVLEMRFYRDLSFKEIADLTGVSINTALGRMRYAILNLRQLAKEKQIELPR